MNDLERRAVAIGKMFLGFGEPSSPERIAVYIEATARFGLESIENGVDLLLRTWTRDKRFPFPADLVQHSRMCRDRAVSLNHQLPVGLQSLQLPPGSLVRIDSGLLSRLMSALGGKRGKEI